MMAAMTTISVVFTSDSSVSGVTSTSRGGS